ncbi:unnamed protein product [Linum trigynum]|uniref:Uncharacterized protein n=1 Tax=Linum trigynum TaxID=586398 RepID=A0AAV2D436_9ROSI
MGNVTSNMAAKFAFFPPDPPTYDVLEEEEERMVWWCQVSRRTRTWMSIRWISKLGTRLWPCYGITLLPDSPFSIPMATPPTSAKCISSSSSSGLISESTSCAMTIQAMEHLLETRRSPAS